MGRRRTWTDEQLIVAAKAAISGSSVLRMVGLQLTGSNRTTVKNAILRLGIDTSHWLGKAHMRGKHHTWSKKLTLHDMLTRDAPVRRASFKKLLLQDGILRNECSECGQVSLWNNKPLVMVLDHINGVHNDYKIKNLRMLCPNCNSQQDTFSGRNLRGIPAKHPRKKTPIFCCKCAKLLTRKNKTRMCFSCFQRIKKESGTKGKHIPNDLLLNIKNLGVMQTSRKYGVSHTTVARWMNAVSA